MKRISITQSEAFALGNTQRIKILKFLQKEHTIEQITKKFKYKKRDTTIRYHVNILVKAGFVKVTRMVEKKGSFLKFYKSTILLTKEVEGKQ